MLLCSFVQLLVIKQPEPQHIRVDDGIGKFVYWITIHIPYIVSIWLYDIGLFCLASI